MTYKPMRKLKPLSHASWSQSLPRFTPCASAYPHLARTTLYSQCRSLAQVRPDCEVFPEIWFTSSNSPRRFPHDENSPPPDERTLKLGKSTILSPSSCSMYNFTDPHPSNPHTSISSPHAPRLSPATRNPLPADHAASLPLHAPAPPQSFRPCRLSCRSLDFSHRLRPHAADRQCQAYHPLRAYGQEWPYACIPLLLHFRQRATSCALEDVREDEGEGNGCVLQGYWSGGTGG